MATSLGRREHIELLQSPPEIINVDELDSPVIPRFRHHAQAGMGDATSSRPTARHRTSDPVYPPPHEVITLSDDDMDEPMVELDVDDDEIIVIPNPNQRLQDEIRWANRRRPFSSHNRHQLFSPPPPEPFHHHIPPVPPLPHRRRQRTPIRSLYSARPAFHPLAEPYAFERNFTRPMHPVAVPSTDPTVHRLPPPYAMSGASRWAQAPQQQHRPSFQQQHRTREQSPVRQLNMGLGGALLALRQPDDTIGRHAHTRVDYEPYGDLMFQAHLQATYALLHDNGNTNGRVIPRRSHRSNNDGGFPLTGWSNTGVMDFLQTPDVRRNRLVHFTPPYQKRLTHPKPPVAGFTHDFGVNAETIDLDENDGEPTAGPSTSSSNAAGPSGNGTTILVCAGCLDPLLINVSGTDRAVKKKKIWGMRCGHLLDGKCVERIMRPPPVINDAEAAPAIPKLERAPSRRGKGKGKGKARATTKEPEVLDLPVVAEVAPKDKLKDEEIEPVLTLDTDANPPSRIDKGKGKAIEPEDPMEDISSDSPLDVQPYTYQQPTYEDVRIALESEGVLQNTNESGNGSFVPVPVSVPVLVTPESETHPFSFRVLRNGTTRLGHQSDTAEVRAENGAGSSSGTAPALAVSGSNSTSSSTAMSTPTRTRFRHPRAAQNHGNYYPTSPTYVSSSPFRPSGVALSSTTVTATAANGRKKSTKARGKAKAAAQYEEYEWECPVSGCGQKHLSVCEDGVWKVDTKLARGPIAVYV